MTASTVILLGRSPHSPGAPLPGWTLPFLVRLGTPSALRPANGGPVLSIVAGRPWGAAIRPGTAA